MDKALKASVILILVFIMVSFTGLSLAQYEGYTYGTVDSVSSDSIAIIEYDYDTDTDKKVIYVVDEQTMIINAPSINDIAVGDNAEIDFIDKGGKKIAAVIAVEKFDEELDSFIEFNEHLEELLVE